MSNHFRILTTRMTGIAATLLMLALLASVVAGVFFRAIGQPLAFSDELAQYLLVWTGFIGWIIATRNRRHIRITVILDRLPRGARIAMEIAIQLAVGGFAIALLWYCPNLIMRNLDIEWVSLPISAALLYIPVPFAAFALLVQAGIEIRHALHGRVADENGSIPL